MRAVPQEKTAECHVMERLSLATPLTSVNWTPLEQFATILPRMFYNSAVAALGCQWLLLVKVTWLLTQAVTVWIFLILVSCECSNILRQISDRKEHELQRKILKSVSNAENLKRNNARHFLI